MCDPCEVAKEIDTLLLIMSMFMLAAALQLGAAAAVPVANNANFSSTNCFDDKITAFMLAGNITIPGASVAVLHRGKLVYAQG